MKWCYNKHSPEPLPAAAEEVLQRNCAIIQQRGHEEVDTEVPESKKNGRDQIHMKPACNAITEKHYSIERVAIII